MSDKKYRFEIIKTLITEQEIGSQDELLNSLSAHGIQVTQATLSRDLRELKVSKLPNSKGEYIYQLTENENEPRQLLHPAKQVSLMFSNNLGVLKTRVGYALGVAAEIDDANFSSIIGTIAGHDTILVIMNENSTREQLIQDLKKIINLKN
ncbi:arginine repressor [Vaginella massiliensis]|uniref:arginine repressor n=1 Tax=Vaginella massiliensis TaxID=1816680 RepID=UPI000839808A|nr:ArgR family transcriptional regulator [Vaginella massiliensis]